AYALLYEDRIVVFYDRIQALSRDNPTHRRMILAHVMTHEITHILQGIERHSTSGVMKARWNETDYLDMTRSPLPFASEDIELIRLGLRRYEAVAASDPLVSPAGAVAMPRISSRNPDLGPMASSVKEELSRLGPCGFRLYLDAIRLPALTSEVRN